MHICTHGTGMMPVLHGGLSTLPGKNKNSQSGPGFIWNMGTWEWYGKQSCRPMAAALGTLACFISGKVTKSQKLWPKYDDLSKSCMITVMTYK